MKSNGNVWIDHRGGVTVLSPGPGQGSEFTVRLPAED